MKIIKRGIPKQERIWRGICGSCGSEAEATESELNNITHDQREGCTFSWETCPVCEAGNPNGYGGILFYLKVVK